MCLCTVNGLTGAEEETIIPEMCIYTDYLFVYLLPRCIHTWSITTVSAGSEFKRKSVEIDLKMKTTHCKCKVGYSINL